MQNKTLIIININCQINEILRIITNYCCRFQWHCTLKKTMLHGQKLLNCYKNWIFLPWHGPRYASPILLPILQDFCLSSQRLRYETPSVPQTIFFKSTCDAVVVRFFCRLVHLHTTHCGINFWSSMHCLPLRQLINLHEAEVVQGRERKRE